MKTFIDKEALDPDTTPKAIGLATPKAIGLATPKGDWLSHTEGDRTRRPGTDN